MNVDLGTSHGSQTSRGAWRATLLARRGDRIYLGLTGAAFVLGVLDSTMSKTLAAVPAMCMMHAAGTGNGLAGRHAYEHLGPEHGWQPRLLLGRLLGVLTLSLAFSAALLATAALGTETAEPLSGVAITAFSGVVWITSLVFLFSTFLPRRLDSVLAVLLFPAGSLLYKSHTQFTNTTLARAVETVWENAGPLVFSDALSRTAAWVDLARWASNITLALVAGLLIAYVRHGRRAYEAQTRRWLVALAMAGSVAIAVRPLIPRLANQVAWIDVAPSDGRSETSAVSRTTGRPTLYNFTADWCVICARLERDLFAEAGDAQWISERFVPVRVLDRKREDGRNDETVEQLRERFQVTGFPTLVVVAPDGAVLARLVGYSGNLTEVRDALNKSVIDATAQSR